MVSGRRTLRALEMPTRAAAAPLVLRRVEPANAASSDEPATNLSGIDVSDRE